MGTITIDQEFFGYLLACLDNQKFMPVPGEGRQGRIERKNQAAIDKANIKGREILARAIAGQS